MSFEGWFDTQEQKAIYDMLRKPDLSKAEIRKIKSVSVELLNLIRTRMESVQDIFDKQSTRDAFRQTIYDFLWSDETGLPANDYSDDDIAQKTDQLFMFFSSQRARHAARETTAA